MVVEHAVVVAEHRDQHRQGEIGVVHAALLAALPMDGIDRPPGAHVGDHLLLAGDDPEEHIGAHHRGDHRADDQKRRAPGEQLAGGPGGNGDEHGDQAQDAAVIADLAVGGVA